MNDSVLRGMSARKRVSDVLQICLRLVAFLLFVLIFLPGVNPARITEKINRNLSLFTSGFAYGSLVSDMGRALMRGWISRGSILTVFFSSMVSCFGIFACSGGACMSVGNNKLKRLGFLVSLGGSLLLLLGMGGLRMIQYQFFGSPEAERIAPMDPFGLSLVLALAVVMAVFSILNLLLAQAPAKGEKCKLETPMELFLLLIPFLILVFVFNYLPLWGWRYAFFNYVPGDTITWDKFVGFKWFAFIFQNSATINDTLRVLRNTLIMSGLGIATSWCSLAFAIFLSEIRSTKLRRAIQTLTTIPNFISWVLVYAVAFCIFSTDGFVSSIFVNNGWWDSGKNLLMGGDFIWFKMLGWGMWKGLGWSAIMYIAAITSIDQQLYEAATVDGAGRFQKMWHVTVPELMPTYMVMLLLMIAGILNNGMEQYLVFENATNTAPITVLDLYVYKLGIGLGHIPLSTLVGMVKSLVSVALLFGANGLSKLIRGTSIV